MNILDSIKQKYSNAKEKWAKYKELNSRLKHTTRSRNQKKLQGEIEISRRQFLQAAWDASKLPLIVAGAGTAGIIIKLLTTENTPPIASKPKIVSIDSVAELRNIALNMLNNALDNNLMSPKYHEFLKTMLRLVEDEKISFTLAKNDSPFPRYNFESNTIEMNPSLFQHYDQIQLYCTLMHELFHAYQDYNKISQKGAEIEADAYLAQHDFLFHLQPDIAAFDGWLKVTDLNYQKKFMLTFFVPHKLIEQNMMSDFSSEEYLSIRNTVAQNYLRTWIFIASFNKATRFQKHEQKKQIEKLYEHALTTISQHPLESNINIFQNKDGISFDTSPLTKTYFMSLRYLIDDLMDRGEKKEALALLYDSFDKFRDVLTSIDYNKYDITFVGDGI